MKFISLGKTIVQSFFFQKSLAKNMGEPVHWTDAETREFLHSLGDNHLMANSFAVAMDLKSTEPFFEMNMDKYLDYKGAFTVEKYFWAVHLDYLEEYLKWTQSIYLYAIELKGVLRPMQQSFRLAVPLKLKNVGYHWVLMQAFPLQMDKDNNMVSHLNIYTPLRPFDPKEKIPLIGDLWDKHARQEEWTQGLWRNVFTTQAAFVITPAQRSILEVLKDEPELTNAQIAERLGKGKNTVDVQNKQILARARDCFPLHSFETVRDVAALLKELAFFEQQFLQQGDGNEKQGAW
jgi:hypothetical protein